MYVDIRSALVTHYERGGFDLPVKQENTNFDNTLSKLRKYKREINLGKSSWHRKKVKVTYFR